LEARTNLGAWLSKLPLKKGASPLRLLPTYEQWALDLQSHGDYDEYWQQRGYAIREYYTEHADVPTVYFGSWYDSYARATTENFVALSKLKKSPQRLVMGPWTHGVTMDQEFSGDVAFGPDDQIRVSEIWDSREQFDAFGERLMPVLKDVGIELSGEPEMLEIHNIIKR